MTKVKDNLDDFLGISRNTDSIVGEFQVVESHNETDLTVPDVEEELEPLTRKSLVDEYEESKNEINRVLYKCEKLLDNLSEVAETSEHARDFEVAGGLAKIFIDGKKTINDMHHKLHKETQPKGSEPNNGTYIQQNNFNMSTKDITSKLKELRNTTNKE